MDSIWVEEEGAAVASEDGADGSEGTCARVQKVAATATERMEVVPMAMTLLAVMMAAVMARAMVAVGNMEARGEVSKAGLQVARKEIVKGVVAVVRAVAILDGVAVVMGRVMVAAGNMEVVLRA